MLATNKGHSDGVQALIKIRARLDIRTNDDKTALTIASDNGHSGISQLLESTLAAKAMLSLTTTCTTQEPQSECFPNKKARLTYHGSTTITELEHEGERDCALDVQSVDAADTNQGKTRSPLSHSMAGIFHSDAHRSKKPRITDFRSSHSHEPTHKI